MLNWIFLEKDLCNPNNTDNSDDTLADERHLIVSRGWEDLEVAKDKSLKTVTAEGWELS